MTSRLLLALSLCFYSCLSLAQTDWREEVVFPKYVGALHSGNGFSGMLVATSNSEWDENWTIVPDALPDFHRAESVATGEQIFVLTFFSNPTVNEYQAVDIACDLQLVKPDGSASFSKKDVACFQGMLVGNVTDLTMAIPVIGFTSEEGDPKGVWKVNVTLKDKLGKQQIPMTVSFTNK